MSKGFSNPDPRIFCYFTCDTLVHAGTLAHPLSPVRETIIDAVRETIIDAVRETIRDAVRDAVRETIGITVRGAT